MDHFAYHRSILHAEDVPIPTIAEAVGTPFYCYSTATLERHYKVFTEAFSANPNTLTCYAVKANVNLAVIKTLAELGAGADTVSQGEIMLARKAGVPANKIVFSGVGKTREEMAYAIKEKIFQFNVESIPELERLNEVALSLGKKAPIAIRVNPDVDGQTHQKITTGRKEDKFGIDWEKAREVFTLAKSLPGLDVKGVAVHIGSQITQITPFEKAFTKVRELVEYLRAEGFPIDRIDCGGGLGIPYKEEMPPSPELYAKTVMRCLHGLQCKLIFEPGRLIVGNAGVLVSRVEYVKKTDNKTFLILDAGMNDLIRPSFYEAYHDIIPVHEELRDKKPVDIVGPVCETSDVFATNRPMPPLKPGDFVAFRSAGAYGASMASTYNVRPLLAEVLVKGKDYAVTRKRQTYKELMGAYKLPEWM